MKTKDIRKLIQLADKTGFTELEIRDAKRVVRIVRSPGIDTPSPDSKELHTIVAPVAGALHLSPAPKSEPFVRIGQQIDAEHVLCSITANGASNQIESDRAGIIREISAEDGSKVEQGQSLFVIEIEG